MSEKASIKKDILLEFTLEETLQLLHQFGVYAVVFDGTYTQVVKNFHPPDSSFDYVTKREMQEGGFYGCYLGIQILGRQVMGNNLAIPQGIPDRNTLLDALRWRLYASSPQTALMLGSDKDPNDSTVDWKAECDRLEDEKMRG